METQLNKASQSIRDITSSLALSAVANIARQFTQRINQSPLNLLDFNPEGIVDKIAQVKEMVDLEGSEEAVAVILWGFGGIGKSTLAASVVKELNPPAADFKFCRAIIDEKTPDMTSHIIKLQKDIIYDFGGGKLDLRNPDEGRQRLKQVVEKERCFLFLDNVVDPEYIKQLLPKDLFPGKKSKENMGSTEAVKEPKLRILITSRENNLRRVLFIKKCKEYHVSELSDKSAKIVFRKTILSEGPDDESELQYNFDEEGLLMNKVAEACKGVPLLLSVFSNCLRIERDRATYQQALKALRMGNLDSFADEKHLSEKLMFVYHKLSEPEAKKGFLDICTYFHGWGWTLVGRIVGSSILETLHKRKLVNRSDSNRVIVHDILRVMGMKMGKETRITNYREFLAAVEDESRLKNVEGVMLEDNTCLATIESTHLDTMHRSLRVLWLGGWVVINGQCDRVFENIKYLGVGDVTVFPFRDMSKLENLTVFDNGSKSGMCLTKLPPTLKCIIHRVPYPDCDEFATLPLQNLQSSELFTVETRKSVKLPKGLKFPPSLVQLNLSRCMQLPSSFSHLTNLEGLRLNECDLESLPQGFGRLAKLKHLSMKGCSNLVHLSEGIGSLCCLTELSVEGCTRLEELPADFGQLTALRKLWMGECASLKALPENFGGLSSLEYLDLRGCISLQRLPESFSRLSIQSLTLESLLSLEELPESIGNLPCLTELILDSCKSLITLPHSFVQLKMLKTLTIKNCINLAALPKDFGELSSLENMTIRSSPVLNELPDGFSAPPALKVLTLLSLRNLVNLPAGFGKLKTLRLLILDSCFKLETLPDDLEKLVFLRGLLLRFCPMLEGAAWDKIARLQHCSLVHIEGSAMLIKRWKEVENEKEYPMVVPTGPRMPTIKDEEGQKAARAGLFSVELKCIELNTSNQELMERSSVSVAVDTTVAVILLPLHLELHHQQVLNTMSEVATQRSTKACSGQLQIIICLRSIEWDEAQQPTEEEEEKNIRKAQRINQSPLNLLDCNPEGIVDKIVEVKEMVDLEGSEAAVAVILWGFGGIGKSTLAASVVQELNPPAADFKFCRAIIDEKMPDMTSHIIKLQKDIIYDFGGGKLDLRNPDEGRQRLKQVVENERCFLFLDNVVDPEYIKELLPKDLFPGKKSKENMGSTEAGKEPKLRILITSRENNLRPVLSIKKCKEYHVSELSDMSAKSVFHKTILSEGPDDESELQYNFDEEVLLMNQVAEACKGVPLLLSIFANCLRIERDRATYQQALEALRIGNLDSFSDEKHLSEKLMFVYHKLREPEAKKGFLDICTYFNGWRWMLVGHIVGSSILETLHKRKLVNRSDSNRVIVHDILRVMGMKMGKETRITNYREFLAAVEDESRLKNVEGVMLKDNTCLATIESTHLDTMHRSLRVLWLGDWVVINGQCDRVFENIKYLEVGDVTVFPFRDMSKLENLTVFDNGSKSGMCLTKLPPTLKSIIHRVLYPDCDEFATLPLQNLQSLELFFVETRKSVNLPKGLKFPPSLVQLDLSGCRQLPSSFSHLTNLERLLLNECDLESLPQGFGLLAKLKYLFMKRCSNLVHLSEGIGSLCCLTELSVEGCTRLEELPADFGQLTALRKLWMGECESLKALPENFGGLSSLEYLDLRGCISLQRLPDSFSRLSIQSLTLESLLSLEELPESIGNLPCLTELILNSCNSLITLPDSFVQLKMLKTLTIKDCINLAALPKDFGELSSLQNMTIDNSPVLNELPDGFSALPALKVLTLKSLRNLVNLPVGFGKLKTLGRLIIYLCFKLETLPDDLQKIEFLRGVTLRFCPVLEGAAMDKIARLQHCYYADIEGSARLIKRWKEVENEKEYPMLVCTGPRIPTIKDEEGQKAARAGLFSVELQCIELNTTNQELKLMERSSVSVSVDTTVAVILLPLHLELHHRLVLNTMSEVATQRSRKACSGQLQIIICLRSVELDEAQRRTEEEEEEENIRKALQWLPQGARAIPVSDIRRRFLFKYLFFKSYADRGKLVCFMAHARVQHEGPVLLVDGESIGEDNISGKLLQNPAKSESLKEEIETSVDELEECLRDLCSESNTEERKFNRFAQALKKKGIDYFIDSNMRKMDIDQVRGRDVCIIICGLHSIEHMRLQQIFKEFQSFNFEGVWIPLLTDDEGHGSYTRACEHMPWLTVQNPKLIQYMPWDNNTKLILFDKEGEMVHIRDMLSLVLAWGVKAYPFTQYKINEVISNRNDKSDLQFLLEDMDLLDCDGVQVDKELINNKLIFLYAGSPNQNLKMKSKLGQLIQVHKEFKILYIGHCSGIEKKDMEAYKKEYEDATQKMQWLKLSFWDTVKFWYKCKYLSNVLGETPNLSLTFLKLVRELYVGKRWLVFLDNNGMVTASGTEVVDIICKLNDENRDDIEIMIGKELMKSFESGKCTKSVQTYFSDEISNHRQHSHHLLLHSKEKGNRICNVCSLYFNIEASDHQRLYICNECDWDLCKDCWEEFVKRQAQCMLEL